jgi:hypothetical protein
VVPAFLFGFYNVMSGRLLFNIWMTQTFNLVTALPVAVYGVMDQDVKERTAMQFPQLYNEAKNGVYFSIAISGWWLLLSVLHSSTAYFIAYIAYDSHVDGVMFGFAVQMLVVFMCNLQLLLHARYLTNILFGSVLLSFIFHLSVTFILSFFSIYIFEDLEYDNVFNELLGSIEMWAGVLLGCAITVVISLTAQYSRSILCPRPFHICTEIERGHFQPSKQYPTRASLRISAGAAVASSSSSSSSFTTTDQNKSGTPAERCQELRSNVKVLPTKSSKSLSNDSSFLKRYMLGLFLDYQDVNIANKDENQNEKKGKVLDRNVRISPHALIQLLQHRALNQLDRPLPLVTNRLKESDMIDLIVALGDADADAETKKQDSKQSDEELSLFRNNQLPPLSTSSTSSTAISSLSKSTFDDFTKALTRKGTEQLLVLVNDTALGNAHRSYISLVLRSTELLNGRRAELGNIFDAYDADGSQAMSSSELGVLLDDIASQTKGSGGSQSDGNPQAEEDEGDPNASYVNTNQTANVTKTNELTTEDLEMFIAAMDANGDGKLGRDEFLDYCMRGMNMRPKQRKKFSKRSPMHAKLQLFITNILKRIETST